MGIDFIEYVQPSKKTYVYCKVNVFDGNGIKNSLYSDWKSEDEVYLMADCSLGNVPSGKQAIKISCFIKNFSKDKNNDMRTDAQQNGSDSTDKVVLQTEYYSIKIPDDWEGKYSYRIIENNTLDGAYNVEIYMNSKNESGEALLFSIQMYEPNDPYAVEAELNYGLHDIYWIETADGKVFDVAWEYSGDRACTDDEVDFYFSLVDEIPQIMETFQLNEGCKKAINIEKNDESKK